MAEFEKEMEKRMAEKFGPVDKVHEQIEELKRQMAERQTPSTSAPSSLKRGRSPENPVVKATIPPKGSITKTTTNPKGATAKAKITPLPNEKAHSTFTKSLRPERKGS